MADENTDKIETPVETTADIDPFDAAFDDYVAGSETTPAAEVKDEKPEPEKEEPKAEDPPVEEPKEDKKAPTPPVQKELPTEPAPAKSEPDLKALVDAEVQKRLDEKKTADDSAAAIKAEAEAKQKAASYSEEESLAIETALREVPELKPVLEAIQRVTLAQAENKFDERLKALEQQFGARIAPLQSTVNTVALNAFDQAVLGAHKDAYDIIPDIEKYVATLPEFMRPAWNKVLDEGTAKETIEMIAQYKQIIGQAPAISQKPNDPPAKQEPSEEEKAKQAEQERKIQQQEGIRGRQVNKTSEALDPNDFESAFDRFAAT